MEVRLGFLGDGQGKLKLTSPAFSSRPARARLRSLESAARCFAPASHQSSYMQLGYPREIYKRQEHLYRRSGTAASTCSASCRTGEVSGPAEGVSNDARIITLGRADESS